MTTRVDQNLLKYFYVSSCYFMALHTFIVNYLLSILIGMQVNQNPRSKAVTDEQRSPISVPSSMRPCCFINTTWATGSQRVIWISLLAKYNTPQLSPWIPDKCDDSSCDCLVLTSQSGHQLVAHQLWLGSNQPTTLTILQNIVNLSLSAKIIQPQMILSREVGKV